MPISSDSTGRSASMARPYGGEILLDKAAAARSGQRSAAKLVQRELGSLVPATLRAVLDVSPRTEQSRPLGVQEDAEGLRDGVDLEPVVGPPGRRRSVRVQRKTLQDAPEAHPIGVEDPRAVAGLQNEERLFGG